MIFLGINPSAIFMPSCIGFESCIKSNALRSLTTSPHKKSTAHLGHRPETGKTFSSKCPSDSRQRSARQEAKFKKLSVIIKQKKNYGNAHHILQMLDISELELSSNNKLFTKNLEITWGIEDLQTSQFFIVVYAFNSIGINTDDFCTFP